MFPFDPPENIRKPKVFWCFQGDQKGTLGSKGLKLIGKHLSLTYCSIKEWRTNLKVVKNLLLHSMVNRWCRHCTVKIKEIRDLRSAGFLFRQFSCLKTPFEQCHVSVSSFIRRKMRSSVNVKRFRLSFAWDSHLQQAIHNTRNKTTFDFFRGGVQWALRSIILIYIKEYRAKFIHNCNKNPHSHHLTLA